MTEGESGWLAVEMAADTLGGERDGRERVLDFVGHALRHFLPRKLALGAKEFRGVFDDEDGAWPAVGQFEPRTGDGQVHVAAAKMEFNFGRGRTHALSAADDAGEFVDEFGAAEGHRASVREARRFRPVP